MKTTSKRQTKRPPPIMEEKECLQFEITSSHETYEINFHNHKLPLTILDEVPEKNEFYNPGIGSAVLIRNKKNLANNRSNFDPYE